jgi:23S rRNA (uracil1939-C5)-methyltransferase
MEMRAGDVFEAEIDSIGCNAEGIARSGGFTVFIPFTDAGERVSARVARIDKSRAFAEKIEILRASEYRVKPPCAYFEKCGGCDCMHLAYGRQTEHKERILKETLSKFFDISDTEFLPFTHGEKRFFYRNKLQIPVAADRSGNTRIGFYEKASHRVVDIKSCMLHGAWADKIIAAVRKYSERYGVSAYDERTGKGILRHIVARNFGGETDVLSGETVRADRADKGNLRYNAARNFDDVSGRFGNISASGFDGGETSVLLVINADELPEYSGLVDILAAETDGFSLHISVNKKNTNVILGGGAKTLVGNPRMSYRTASGIEASVSPLSFAQVNGEVRDLIYADTAEFTRGADAVIDAYSGGGVLTAMLAGSAERVYGIEVVKEAVADADTLAVRNGIRNVENILGEAEKKLPPLVAKLKREEKKLAVVLDPPRKGCGEAVVGALKRSLPEKIAYISCNPATLGRDLSLLQEKYDIISVRGYDMFPNTKHIEVLCRLEIKN